MAHHRSHTLNCLLFLLLFGACGTEQPRNSTEEIAFKMHEETMLTRTGREELLRALRGEMTQLEETWNARLQRRRYYSYTAHDTVDTTWPEVPPPSKILGFLLMVENWKDWAEDQLKTPLEYDPTDLEALIGQCRVIGGKNWRRIDPDMYGGLSEAKKHEQMRGILEIWRMKLQEYGIISDETSEKVKQKFNARELPNRGLPAEGILAGFLGYLLEEETKP